MSYHFIGLGGIGMSGLARILLQKGHKVQGSDLKTSALLEELEKEGATIQIGHRAESLLEAARVVYSTDIKEDNVELIKAKEENLPLLHRSDLLHELMEEKKALLVTGTHGKTTTTALLSRVLIEADLDPSFVIGGLIRPFNINAKAGKGEYFVAEADESDGSFLKTSAYAAIVTNLHDDHLDHWGSSRMLELAFQQFIAQTKNLFWCCDDERLSQLKPKGVSYGFSEKADMQISQFRQTKEGIIFDLGPYLGIELSLLGRHNALNGAAVFSLALSLGIREETIRLAFKRFLGTLRRLEFKGEKHKVALYDDYGHHPNEIRATLRALRESIHERRLIAVFQPHRYTRVRDLFEDFTASFEDADEVIITDIYSAGQAPISGVTTAALYTRLREKLGPKVHYFPRTHLESGVAMHLKPLDVVLTIGAGDITHAAEPILELYAERAPKLTVGVIAGGTSLEHAVSLMSAKNILSALDPAVYVPKFFEISKEGRWNGSLRKFSPEILEDLLQCDVCIPVLHGPEGEDGMIAAFLQTLGLPYVGCDHSSGALCMHKGWAKKIVMQENVPVGPFFQMSLEEYQENPEAIFEKIGSYPVYIKPVHLGSSIGVTRAESPEEVVRAVEIAFRCDRYILVEKEMIGRQIEFSLMGNDSIKIAPPGEIINQGAFVGYDKKYGAGAMEVRVPAELSQLQIEIGSELALKVYRACHCKGLARIDFFLDSNGHYWFNEINPFPGFTDTSAYPKMWKSARLSSEELLDHLLVLAFHRSRKVGAQI